MISRLSGNLPELLLWSCDTKFQVHWQCTMPRCNVLLTRC